MSNISPITKPDDGRPIDLRMRDSKEARSLIGLGQTKFWDEIRNGRLKPVYVGRKALFSLQEIERYIANLPGRSSTAAKREAR